MTTRCLGVASATSASARTRRTTTRRGAVGGWRETRAHVEGGRARGVAARGERASERGRRASALLGDQEVRAPRGRAAGEDHGGPRAFRSPPRPHPPPIARSASESASARFSFSRGKIQAGGAARARARARPADRSRPAPARRSPPPPVDRSARARAPARAAPRIAGPPDRVVVRGRSAPCAPQARIEQAGKRSHREPASRSGLTRRTVFGFWFLVFGLWFLVFGFFLMTLKGGKKRLPSTTVEGTVGWSSVSTPLPLERENDHPTRAPL